MSSSRRLALAESVAAEGFGHYEWVVGELISEARLHGIDEILVGILGDRSAPRVVRERALGRVIVSIQNRTSDIDGEPRPAGPCSNNVRTSPSRVLPDLAVRVVAESQVAGVGKDVGTSDG